MTYREKVRQGIIVRLKNIQPYIDHWDEALAWMSHPANYLIAHQTMTEFAGMVLQAADDQSVRVNSCLFEMDWYYKRYKIIGVVLASELYMLTDKSPGFKDTYEFVDRALADLEKGEELMSDLWGTIFGLWTAKNSFIDMLKPPKVSQETRDLKNHFQKYGEPQNLGQRP